MKCGEILISMTKDIIAVHFHGYIINLEIWVSYFEKYVITGRKSNNHLVRRKRSFTATQLVTASVPIT